MILASTLFFNNYRVTEFNKLVSGRRNETWGYVLAKMMETKGKPRKPPGSSEPDDSLRGFFNSYNGGFPLMTAFMRMVMMPIVVTMLLGVFLGFMPVFLTIVGVRFFLMLMIMFMFFTGMAAHLICTSFPGEFLLSTYFK